MEFLQPDVRHAYSLSTWEKEAGRVQDWRPDFVAQKSSDKQKRERYRLLSAMKEHLH